MSSSSPPPPPCLQETRTLAEIAKAELDGTILNNRPIRIRFATHGAALTVRNLLPVVTNELLEQVYWTKAIKSQKFNRIGMFVNCTSCVCCSVELLISLQ